MNSTVYTMLSTQKLTNFLSFWNPGSLKDAQFLNSFKGDLPPTNG